MSLFTWIYLLSLVMALLGGLYALVLQPALLLSLRLPVVRYSAVLLLGLGALGGVSLAAAQGAGQLVIEGLAEALVTTLILHFLIAAAVAPQAGAWACSQAPERAAWRPRTIALWAGALLAWSWLSLLILELLIDFTVRGDFLLRDATPSRPLEFLAIACFALAAAVSEEWVFRGFLQPLIARTALGKWGGIVIPSLLWTVGHAGYIQPVGVKEVQLLGLGIIIGMARHRFGLGAAILLHVINNGVALLAAVFFPTMQW